MPPEEDGVLPPEVASAVERLDVLVKRFEQHPEPAVQMGVLDLLQDVDTIHRAGMRRLGELLKVAGLQQRALDDPEVRLLFDLYDLGEGGERARAEAVTEALRAQLESYGAALELVDAEPGSLRVRLAPPLDGGEHLAESLRETVVQLLREALPGVASSVEVARPAAALPPRGNFVPITSLTLPPRPEVIWRTALAAEELPVGAVRAVLVDGEPVLVAGVQEGETYAYRNACPGTPLPLDAGGIEEGVLVCPWHACRFDLRGGRRLDGGGPGLGVVPISVEAGEIRIGTLQKVAA